MSLNSVAFLPAQMASSFTDRPTMWFSALVMNEDFSHLNILKELYRQDPVSSVFSHIFWYMTVKALWVSFCRPHLMLYLYHPATWSGRVQEGLNLGFSRLQNKHRSYALRHSVYLFWAHLCCRYDYFIVLFRERIAFFCHLIIVTNQQRW